MKTWALAALLAMGNATAATPVDNPELQRMEQQDQADRNGADIDWSTLR